jgi:hypothetical protein
LQHAPLSRAYREGYVSSWKFYTLLMTFVTLEFGWLCENAFNGVTKPVWEGIDMCLVNLRAVIFRKLFPTLMAFVAGDVRASGADMRTRLRSVQGPFGSRRLPAASPSTVDAKARRNWCGENKIAACSNLIARRLKDARSGRPNAKWRRPQLLLHLAAFQDSLAKYMRALSSTARSEAAVPSQSL